MKFVTTSLYTDTPVTYNESGVRKRIYVFISRVDLEACSLRKLLNVWLKWVPYEEYTATPTPCKWV